MIELTLNSIVIKGTQSRDARVSLSSVGDRRMRGRGRGERRKTSTRFSKFPPFRETKVSSFVFITAMSHPFISPSLGANTSYDIFFLQIFSLHN